MSDAAAPAWRVRRATAADVPGILAISNEAAVHTAANFAVEPETLASWEESFRETAALYPWLVAVDDREHVLAFAKASPWKGRCAYEYSVEITVYVRPETHRRGIGRGLYERLIPTLRRQGYHSAIAGIALPNDASVRLHEAFGLVHVGTFQQVGWKFDRWHDVGYWQILLAEPGATRPHLRPVDDVFPVDQ
ncbi:MAG: N-acetyltransferase [Phycisphaerales bacterium]|nr:GNAT family N-acetyltransferase [Phycisphaerae bacterium]NNF44981.1 N-acetyltransferase [Phycisphaerales bacterium]NNM27769.1 N-acetyltransferase [Phycisphaerales bacterium]